MPPFYLIKLDLKESYEDLALTYVKRSEVKKALINFYRADSFTDQLLKSDPENYEFWIAKLRGCQGFGDALLEQGEKKSARSFYEKSLHLAERTTPAKYTGFVEKLRAEIIPQLRKTED